MADSRLHVTTPWCCQWGWGWYTSIVIVKCCMCLNLARSIGLNSEFDPMICPLVILWNRGAQMDVWGMLARHEEIRRQKQGAEKCVIVGFPAERTTSVEIRHTHACHEELRHHPCGPSSQPVHMCWQTSAQFGRMWGFLGYPSGTCSLFVWHQRLRCLRSCCCQPRMPAETSLPSADPRRKTGKSAYLLQVVLSDKYRHVKLLFFLGIASLDKTIAHMMVNPWSIESLRRCARHTQICFFGGALAPRLANAPFVESRMIQSSGDIKLRWYFSYRVTRKFYITAIIFPGINFSALHYIIFTANISGLIHFALHYIILTPTLRLHLVVVYPTLH